MSFLRKDVIFDRFPRDANEIRRRTSSVMAVFLSITFIFRALGRTRRRRRRFVLHLVLIIFFFLSIFVVFILLATTTLLEIIYHSLSKTMIFNSFATFLPTAPAITTPTNVGRREILRRPHPDPHPAKVTHQHVQHPRIPPALVKILQPMPKRHLHQFKQNRIRPQQVPIANGQRLPEPPEHVREKKLIQYRVLHVLETGPKTC